MTKAQLKGRYATLYKLQSKIGQKLIAAGRGHELSSVTRGKSDALSLEFIKAADEMYNVVTELNRITMGYRKPTPAKDIYGD